MGLSSYSALQSSISDFLNRSDLAAVVPDFITLAEAQINRRLMKDGPVREMMGRSDATIDSEFIGLPDDFLGARVIYLAPNYKPIRYVEPEKIIERKTLYPSEDGDPQVFSVVGSEFQFWPWNGSSFSGELTYWKQIPALSNTNTSNWLLTKHPDAYLYGALLQSAPYLKDDPRLTIWGTLFQAVLDDIVAADKLARQSTHLEVTRVPGTTP